MSLLKASQPDASKTIKIKGEILERAKDYCNFAKLESLDEMVNKSLDFVMKKDREFNKLFKQK